MLVKSMQNWFTEHPKEGSWVVEFHLRERLGGYFPEDDFDKQDFFIAYFQSLNAVEKRKADAERSKMLAQQGKGKRR